MQRPEERAKSRTCWDAPPRCGAIEWYMSQTKETLSTVNRLIETLKDGQEGFREASEAVQSSDLKRQLSEYSLQRSKFAGELQNYAHHARRIGSREHEQHGGRVAPRVDQHQVRGQQPR